jgi:hypothetical protein
MSPQPCGTVAAYMRHRRRKQPACRPCLDAMSAYQKQWRDSQIDERRRIEGARARAWRRLAALYPVEYRRIYQQELCR